MSLNAFLSRNQEKGKYPFHMPGHKRNREFLDIDVLDMDITEIYGADNLHHPDGLIKDLQNQLAALYKSKESFLLINGSSGGIIAAIMSVCGDGDEILVARNSHKSVFTGLILSGAKPLYIYPQVSREGFCLDIKPEKIAQALKANKKIKAIIITNPTYEGVCSDIREIARITHDAGAVLIVDEAHGAHFGFHEYFPESSVSQGADIVIHGLHKTMPVLTQTAALHLNSERGNPAALASALSMIQSSSPSYVLMAAAEKFIYKFSCDAKKYFDNYVNLLYSVRNELSLDNAVRLLKLGEVYDRSKLLLYTGVGFSGIRLEYLLREEFGIEVEMSGVRHILALTSVADSKEGFDRLKSAVKAITAGITNFNDLQAPEPHMKAYYELAGYNGSGQGTTPRLAYQKCREGIIKNMVYTAAEGEISAEFVALYPPGVPLLVPGERITGKVIETISCYLEYGLNLNGINEGMLSALK